jgi:hypothetical protein
MPHSAPLHVLYGLSVEEVRIHTSDFYVRRGSYLAPVGSTAVSVRWPTSLKRLRIVYIYPRPVDSLTTLSTGTDFTFGSEIDQAKQGVLGLVSGVEAMRPSIHITIDLSSLSGSGEGIHTIDSLTLSGEMFIKAVREGYSALLKSRGISAKDKAKRMEALIVEVKLD